MTARDNLEAMLATDPRDVGCEETFALVHAYAEILLAGRDPEQEMPGVAAHLAGCGPCAEEYVGLLAAVRLELSP